MEWLYVILDHLPTYPTCHHVPHHYSSHPHHFIRQLHEHRVPSSPSGDFTSSSFKWKKKYHKHGIQSILQIIGCKHSVSITDDLFHTLSTKYDGSTEHSHPIEVTITYDAFLSCFFQSLEKFGYTWTPSLQRSCQLAFRLKDRQQSMTLLLGGSSGCGKSTLASLIGSRLSITTVLSTDNVRHLLRHFYSKEDIPVLWTSSYYADTALTDEQRQLDMDPVIVGYEAQNDALFSKLDEIICYFEQRNESLILEGVHLSIPIIEKLMQRHSSCIPFLIYISNQQKHTERFAGRARYMTLAPEENKYIKYFGNIRKIHDYLVEKAIDMKIPIIDNSNVDRSLSLLHQTVLNTLTSVLEQPTPLYDVASHTTPLISLAFENAFHVRCESETMLQASSISLTSEPTHSPVTHNDTVT